MGRRDENVSLLSMCPSSSFFPLKIWTPGLFCTVASIREYIFSIYMRVWGGEKQISETKVAPSYLLIVY